MKKFIEFTFYYYYYFIYVTISYVYCKLIFNQFTCNCIYMGFIFLLYIYVKIDYKVFNFHRKRP